MVKFIIQYLNASNLEWIDARTAFDHDEAIKKENEVKQTDVETRIIPIEESKENKKDKSQKEKNEQNTREDE